MSDEIQKLDMRDCQDKTIKPGDKVKLSYLHRRAGEIGTYIGLERIRASGGYGCLVRFDEGVDGCYVFHASQWEKVTP